MNRWPVPYSQFILDNFTLADHRCEQACSCHQVGCTKHWVYKDVRLPDRQQMSTILATWQAFRNKAGCQNAFLQNFDRIGGLVRPISDLTLFCDWSRHGAMIAEVYNQTRDMLQGSVVCATKTLHFFAPDMFIILDRGQVFRPWKEEFSRPGYRLITGPIESVDGAKYVSLLKAASDKVINSIRARQSVVLNGRQYPRIADVGAFRMISPLAPHVQQGKLQMHPNTIGKVLDNIMRHLGEEE